MASTQLITGRESFPCADGFSMPAYLTRPSASTPLPAIVCIYEIFGITTEMERVANDFASAGYVVMMPDLFSRGNWISCVRKLMNDVKNGAGQGVQDLLEARKWLISQPFVDPTHTATIGFCLGGGFALILAKTGLFQVAAPFYGQSPDRLDGTCPIVGSYGALDKAMLPQAKKLQQEAARLQIPNDIKIYPEAGHGFMNTQTNPAVRFLLSVLPVHIGYSPEAAADATARVVNFLQAHI